MMKLHPIETDGSNTVKLKRGPRGYCVVVYGVPVEETVGYDLAEAYDLLHLLKQHFPGSRFSDPFHRVYDRLSQFRKAGSVDWMEYRRVKRQWRRAGRPRPIQEFIRKHANS